MSARTRSRSTSDWVLMAFFVVFAFTSIVMEPYVVFGADLSACTDPLGRAWHFYAASWDPIFLDPPMWLRIACTVDFAVFGPLYILLLYGFWHRRNSIRLPGLVYAAAILYSTLVYFGVEFIAEADRADLLMVTIVNAPYTLVPAWLAWRLRRPSVFADDQAPA